MLIAFAEVSNLGMAKVSVLPSTLCDKFLHSLMVSPRLPIVRVCNVVWEYGNGKPNGAEIPLFIFVDWLLREASVRSDIARSSSVGH